MPNFHSASLKPFVLPPAPATETGPVKIWSAPVTIPTYLPAPADPLPIFLENRVYQGSSGKVYPLPVIDRIASQPVPHTWQAIHLENEYLRIMVLPEIGGRIHIGLDKTNGYDFFYRQNVIKPALVGLAGPWISGGVEFNWPQHHRPATFMPCETALERHPDGSATIWCSQHDPISHMKGMHGVTLHPGRALIELKARLDNRTEDVQTFLWWANVATRVHEKYQSFFPPDVRFVADHAKRAITSFPHSDRPYYGVDYPARAQHGVPPEEAPTQFIPDGSYPPDDLSWYANIPVPTSYMITATADDFFGGYDHAAEAGVVHVANHHIAPGKKQWTWGNHEFGYNWDRCLTDPDDKGEYAPYIELMAGVYTDNQPDFSFLTPGETKTFSQYWYPIRKTGVPQAANLQAAMSLRITPSDPTTRACHSERSAQRGVEEPPHSASVTINVTEETPNAHITLHSNNQLLAEWHADLTPSTPFLETTPIPTDTNLSLTLEQNGATILRYAPAEITPAPAPEAATEPPPPADITSNDELYLTGLHLQQYRHATRHPEIYWQEALRRDPNDSRSNTALGTWHLKRGEFAQAEQHLRTAIARLTHRNPNPYDGEPHYQLGLTLRYLRRFDEAYAAFYKSTWNAAWRGPAYHALAELDARKQNWPTALDHITRSLRANADNLNAQSLRAIALLHLGREREAHAQLTEALALDPLHNFARHLLTAALPPDGQSRLDLAFDFARAGLHAEAIAVLAAPIDATENDGSAPMRHYTRAALLAELDQPQSRVPQVSTLRPGSSAPDLDPPPQSPGAPSMTASPSWVGRNPPTPATNQTQSPGAPSMTASPSWVGRNPPTPATNQTATFAQAYAEAAALPTAYVFPNRLEEIAVLETAIAANPKDARAPLYLGNLLYDRRRHIEAITQWERSAALDPTLAVTHRNLAIAYFNIAHDTPAALASFDRAFAADPTNPRLLYERDQLWKRTGVAPATRLAELLRHPALPPQRDDLSVELATLLNRTGQPRQALDLILARQFQPWEGGEGLVLAQFVRASVLLAQQSLASNNAAQARQLLIAALTPPHSLGESNHLLANQSELLYWLGVATAATNDTAEASTIWQRAARTSTDFQQMAVAEVSPNTFWAASCLEALNQKEAATTLFQKIQTFAQALEQRPPASIQTDYFATSLPAMLLFHDDLVLRNRIQSLFLRAQAALGLRQPAEAESLAREVLQLDPSHTGASDLLQRQNVAT